MLPRRASASRSTFTTSTGEEFHVPAPLDWSDEIVELQTAAAAAKAKPDEYPPISAVVLARAFLECGGEGQWERFRAAGGKAMRFMTFLEEKLQGNAGE
jgi:hypothetical protein